MYWGLWEKKGKTIAKKKQVKLIFKKVCIHRETKRVIVHYILNTLIMGSFLHFCREHGFLKWGRVCQWKEKEIQAQEDCEPGAYFANLLKFHMNVSKKENKEESLKIQSVFMEGGGAKKDPVQYVSVIRGLSLGIALWKYYLHLKDINCRGWPCGVVLKWLSSAFGGLGLADSDLGCRPSTTDHAMQWRHLT